MGSEVGTETGAGRGYERGHKLGRRRGRIENENGNGGENPRTNTKMGMAIGAGTATREVVETRTGTEEGGGEMKNRKKLLPIHSGHQVRWAYQPGSHRRKVTQEEGHTGF